MLGRSPRLPRRRATLRLIGWPKQLRLSSLPIVLLLTSHSVALIYDLNIIIDASMTVVALMLMLLVGDGRGNASDHRRRSISPFAVAAVAAVALATLFSASVPAIARLAVLAAFYLLVPLAVARYRQTSILAGIIVYGIVECALVLVFLDEFNPNAAAQRLIVACCAVGYCVGPWWVRYAALGVATVFGIGLESRTALGSAWIAFAYVELTKTKSLRFLGKQPIVFLAMIGLVLGTVRSVAMDYLVHDSPKVVREFFWDKQERDLEDDPFDRKEMWATALGAVWQDPWIGKGLGNELDATGKFRAHNAYMKLAIESGVPAALVVVVFFLAMLHQSFRRLLAAKSNAMTQVTCFCLIYLLISACFESSGMFSIGTSTNLIAYLGFAWTHSSSSKIRRPPLSNSPQRQT